MNNYIEELASDTENNYILNTANNNIIQNKITYNKFDNYVDTIEGITIAFSNQKKRKFRPEYTLFEKNTAEFDYYKQYNIKNIDIMSNKKNLIESNSINEYKETYIDSILNKNSIPENSKRIYVLKK